VMFVLDDCTKLMIFVLFDCKDKCWLFCSLYFDLWHLLKNLIQFAVDFFLKSSSCSWTSSFFVKNFFCLLEKVKISKESCLI
jgi:hypothetical protein